MNIDVTTQTDIDRPRTEVAAFAADPDNATTWYADIKSVRWETEKPLRVGSRVAFEARFLGRSLAYTYEIRELEPCSRLVMSTDEGPFPMETTYTWHDTPSGGTHMTLRNRGEPSGFASIAAPLMAAQVRKSTSRNCSCSNRSWKSVRPPSRGASCRFWASLIRYGVRGDIRAPRTKGETRWRDTCCRCTASRMMGARR